MQAFKSITSNIAKLKLDNIDTDMIIPKQFLKTIKRSGLGKNLFDEMRYKENGDKISDFVLNQDKFSNSKILITGDNFGCGSSREHAPWAILDFGIRVIIASSYADIFYNNCFKNSILPIQLSKQTIKEIYQILEHDPDLEAIINLEAQEIILSDIKTISFDIDDFKKKCLLEGLDEISLTLDDMDLIKSFEDKRKKKQTWY